MEDHAATTTGYLVAGSDVVGDNNVFFSPSMLYGRNAQQPARFAAAAALGIDPNLDDGDAHMVSHAAWEGDASHAAPTRKEDPQGTRVASELDVMRNKLNALDMEADIFTVPSRQRSDGLSFFQQVVQTIVVILAVLHNKHIEQHNNIVMVIAILWLVSFLNTQLNYALAHWSNVMAGVKRDVQRIETLMSNNGSTQRMAASSASIQEQQETREQGQLRLELEEARRRGVAMQAQVWLGSSTEMIGFLSRALGLINLYVAFLLVKIIMDRLDANFSDGLWLTYRILTFILLVAPVYVEFHISNYRQTAIAADEAGR